MPDNFTLRVKQLLRQAGCEFVRHDKGDHEIWQSPVEAALHGDNNIKSRHWANHTLRQAGLPKTF